VGWPFKSTASPIEKAPHGLLADVAFERPWRALFYRPDKIVQFGAALAPDLCDKSLCDVEINPPALELRTEKSSGDGIIPSKIVHLWPARQRNSLAIKKCE